MSSRNHRVSKRLETTRSRSNATTSEMTSTATASTRQRNGRVGARAVASDKKTYCVDSDDEDDDVLIKNTKESSNPTKRMAASSSSKPNMENVAQLESITGLPRTQAIELLEASGHDLEKAIELHFGGEVIASKPSIKSNGTTNGKAKTANKRAITEVESEINSELVSSDSNSQSYFDSGDNVRAPIAPTFGRLCDYDPYAIEISSKRSRVDGFRNMREEFNDSLATGSSRVKNFSTLFRPPIDLLFDGSFEASKVRACIVNKWVILNVQNHDDFACKCLNRDLWSDETVKEIVKANFVFNQIYFDSIEGQKLVHIYNISAYPYIAIIDPRTGEKLIQLQSNKLDSCTFCEKITSFLCDFEMPNVEEESVPSNEMIKIGDDDVEVIEDSNSLKNQPKSKEAPKKAGDILNDIYSNGNSSDNIQDLNDSYEDDTVISKKKYDKIKDVEKTSDESSASTTSVQKPAQVDSQKVKNDDAKVKIDVNHKPKVIQYEKLDAEKKDCMLRITYPNGDRLEFSTNGNCRLKYLTEYLIKEGYRIDTYELIERLMPTFLSANQTKSSESNEIGSILDITEQSRNLFHKNPNLTFKELNLYPRVALLLQEA